MLNISRLWNYTKISAELLKQIKDEAKQMPQEPVNNTLVVAKRT